MAELKKTFKKIGRQIWELFKGSLPGGLMYACAGAVLVILTLKGEISELQWNGAKIAWTVVCIVVASAYAGIMAYAHGGNAYEMLVTGNMKRLSASESGGYKISKHVYAKEYRVWKGFVMGAFMGIVPLLSGIIFGAKQSGIDAMLADLMLSAESSNAISSGFGIVMLIILFLSGWSILPFFIPNAAIVAAGGTGMSYYLSCLFALIPVVIVGVMYIAGAYGKRAKAIREQEIADRAAAAEANREKKVNYGGLPGTKPKKRK
ncbi:MAG: hypothetical protein IJ329_03900 [Clostridia bacterium]|nr:hypothetical protein [Clostridia bacterium]